MRLVDADNFDGDYPDEHFYPFIPQSLTLEDAKKIAMIINNLSGPCSSRYCKIVDNDYKLRPGFEP